MIGSGVVVAILVGINDDLGWHEMDQKDIRLNTVLCR